MHIDVSWDRDYEPNIIILSSISDINSGIFYNKLRNMNI